MDRRIAKIAIHVITFLTLSTPSRAAVAQEPGFPIPPDTRSPKCPKAYNFTHEGMKASIIIPWHAEKKQHIIETLKSLVYYTPDALVEEYLFISDGNRNSYEKELLAISPLVRVVGWPKRRGLIISKTIAAEEARGPVILFFEAHCRANRYWLEPLLARLEQKPKMLAMPRLDRIPQENWQGYYTIDRRYHWRYEWNLNLISTVPWGDSPVDNYTPFLSPGTSGGIFAMKKDWFDHLGFFDKEMLDWGGDHFELTMKVWRCGGRIEIIPCSRVGHLFRDEAHRPYDVKVNNVVRNYARLAEVWLPDHLSYFYRMKPEAKPMDLGDLTELQANHDNLKCKDMQWYLDTVDHEMKWEMTKLCHPFVHNEDRCKADLLPGRWTITKHDEMPVSEFMKAKKRIQERSLAAKSKKEL